MSKATYVQPGESLDYVNTTTKTIPAGTIISLITRIGVAGTDIEPGGTGTIHVCGVFKIEKTKAADIPMGAAVFFDGTGITIDKDNGEADNLIAYVPAGYAVALAASADPFILVKLD